MRRAFMLTVCFILSFATACVAQDVRYEVQDPKSETMELTPFNYKLFNFQFNIKYPEKWYASEEYYSGKATLFLTREPVKSVSDIFKVGMSLSYEFNFFLQQESPDTNLGRMAKAVFRTRPWGAVKKELFENMRKMPNTKAITSKDITISNQPASQIDYESDAVKMTTYYVKAGIHLLVIIAEAPSSEFPEYENTFKDMIDSFSFSKDFDFKQEEEILATKTEEMMRK